MLAWVGQWLLDGISQSISVLSECFFPFAEFENCSAQLGSKSCMVFPFLQQDQLPNFYISNPVLILILSMWPKYLRLICWMTIEIFCICSLSRISSDGHCSDRLMVHIHLVICISIRWSLQVSSMLTDHASLLYNTALLTQAFGNCNSFYVKALSLSKVALTP